MDTEQEFKNQIVKCKDVFLKKALDYSTAWRIMRPSSITDQIFIKANRIRSLEMLKEHLVEEGREPEFVAMVNYSIMGLIQLELGFADTADLTVEDAEKYYDKYSKAALELMLKKNHDYGQAWIQMRSTSITDLILMKIYRIKQIEDHNGKTLVSEGIDAGYYDIINYSIFNLIKLENEKSGNN
ncbi:MAG: DUF1599 domain-containing protein [Bacteroidales bacterium]|nr:DUF1599 domain-containing protein [Bacteroidales bacterium]